MRNLTLRAPGAACHLIAGATLLLLSCSPDIEFLGDSALAVISGDPAAVERELQTSAGDDGKRFSARWQPGPLDTPWVDQAVDESAAPTVILSPYFSLFADDIARANPDKTILAYHGSDAGLDNLVRVRFDPVPACARLGRLAAEWVFEEPGRIVAVFVIEDDPATESAVVAMERSYAEESGLELDVRRIASPPSREETRALLSRISGEVERFFVLFLGESTQYALEAIQGDGTLAAVRYGAGMLPVAAGVKYQVRDRLADGLSAFLSAGFSDLPSVITVPSTLIGPDGPIE